jgi:hypothetical protein
LFWNFRCFLCFSLVTPTGLHQGNETRGARRWTPGRRSWSWGGCRRSLYGRPSDPWREAGQALQAIPRSLRPTPTIGLYHWQDHDLRSAPHAVVYLAKGYTVVQEEVADEEENEVRKPRAL